jgi:hypothetical protein
MGFNEIINYGNVAGAYNARSPGGTTVNEASIKPADRVRSYKHTGEATTTAAYPCFRQSKVQVSPGRTLLVTVDMYKDWANGTSPKCEIIDAFSDTLNGGTALATQSLENTQNTWFRYTLSWTNTTDYPVAVLIRTSMEKTSGNFYSVYRWETECPVAVGNVKDGVARSFDATGIAVGTYSPGGTYAEGQANQYSTNQAEVTAKAAYLDSTQTICGIGGTLNMALWELVTTGNSRVATQLSTDQAAVEAVTASISTTVVNLLGTVDGTLNLSLYSLIPIPTALDLAGGGHDLAPVASPLVENGIAKYDGSTQRHDSNFGMNACGTDFLIEIDVELPADLGSVDHPICGDVGAATEALQLYAIGSGDDVGKLAYKLTNEDGTAYSGTLSDDVRGERHVVTVIYNSATGYAGVFVDGTVDSATFAIAAIKRLLNDGAVFSIGGYANAVSGRQFGHVKVRHCHVWNDIPKRYELASDTVYKPVVRWANVVTESIQDTMIPINGELL